MGASSRVPVIGKREPNKSCTVQLFSEFPDNLWDFFVKFVSSSLKIRNNMENIVCLPCKWSKYESNKTRQWEYYVIPLKRNLLNNFWLTLQFTQFCHDIKLVVVYVFSPSPQLGQALSVPPNFFPLKPMLILCHPLIINRPRVAGAVLQTASSLIH